jgi:hypothetical protein
VQEVEANLERYIEKAKQSLKKKYLINPKPKKRIITAQAIAEDDESECENHDTELQAKMLPPAIPKQSKPPVDVDFVMETSDRTSLRPVRTAKINASKGLVIIIIL